MTFIASLGIGMLVGAAKFLERHGAKLVLVAPQELVRKALETSCLHKVMPIVDGEASANELLGVKRS